MCISNLLKHYSRLYIRPFDSSVPYNLQCLVYFVIGHQLAFHHSRSKPLLLQLGNSAIALPCLLDALCLLFQVLAQYTLLLLKCYWFFSGDVRYFFPLAMSFSISDFWLKSPNQAVIRLPHYNRGLFINGYFQSFLWVYYVQYYYSVLYLYTALWAK